MDSGAFRSFITQDVANKLKGHRKVITSPCNIRCTTAQQQIFTATELITVLISIDKFTWKFEFVVAPSLAAPVILGCDFINKTKLVPYIFYGYVFFDFMPHYKIPLLKNEEQQNIVHFNGIQIDDEIRGKIENLLEKHKEVVTERLGKTNILNYEIKLTDNVPVRSRFYPLSPPKAAEMEAHINQLLDKGIIEKSSSPYASPAFLVDKASGGKRLCCDYRAVNKKIVYDSYPMPSIESVFQYLGGARYFSIVDLNSSFHQIPLSDESKPVTAFISPFGLFQYKYVPFGLCVSPQSLNRVVDMIFGDIKYKYIIPFVDDICVFSKDKESHVQHLDEVLTRLGKAGLTVNPKKLKLCQESVQFLGYNISYSGLAVDPDKISVVVNYPEPKNLKQLKTFLGMTSFYAKFIPRYSELAEPLNSLKKKDAKYVWGPKQVEAFGRLKQQLVSPNVLRFPDFSKKFILQSDASGTALGAVLQQEVDGALAPVCYASRTLSSAERRHTVYELECAAAVFGVTKFKQYLEVAPFEIQTDNAALSWLFEHPKQIGKLGRWILLLSRFKFNIKHIKGSCNNVADCLSRMYEGTEEVNCYALQDYPVTNDSLARHQINDKFCNDIIIQINGGTTVPKYKMKNELLCRQIGKTNKWRIVLPNHLKKIILNYYHDQDIAGHLGITKTLNRITSIFWWKNAYTDIKEYVRSCLPCQTSKPLNKKPVGLMSSTVPTETWERVYIDYKGPFPTSKNGNKYILVILDGYSKWVQLIAVRAATAANTVRALSRLVWANYGPPRTIVSDNATHFTADVFKQMCQVWGINDVKISPYYPQANAAERVNRNLSVMLNIYCRKTKSVWDESLPNFQLALNTAVHESSNCTPSSIFLGREIRSPLENKWELDKIISDELTHNHEQRTEARNLNTAHERQEYYYNNRRRANTFNVGQQVLAKCFPLTNADRGVCAAFCPRWSGPYTIKDITNGQAKITKPNSNNFVKRVNISQLKPYCSRLSGGGCDNVQFPSTLPFPKS